MSLKKFLVVNILFMWRESGLWIVISFTYLQSTDRYFHLNFGTQWVGNTACPPLAEIRRPWVYRRGDIERCCPRRMKRVGDTGLLVTSFLRYLLSPTNHFVLVGDTGFALFAKQNDIEDCRPDECNESGIQDSNLWPLGPKPSALPTEPIPANFINQRSWLRSSPYQLSCPTDTPLRCPVR